MAVIFLLFLLLFLGSRLVVALFNYQARSFLPFVRRLKDPPFVSVIIVGDNDTARMLYQINLLQHLPYANLEILVGIYNPLSKPLQRIQEAALQDKRFRIVEIQALRKGWKEDNLINYTLGMKARGNYLLFMDPDLELRNGILEILISYMKQQRLGLVSVAPTYDLHTRAEWMTLPILNQLYLTLYPLGLVRKRTSSFAMASREFMLFEGEVYRIFQPFDEARIHHDGAWCAADYLKSESIGIDCLIGDKRVRLLGYVTWQRCLTQLISELTPFIGRYHVLAIFYGILLAFWWLPFVIWEAWGLFVVGIIEILVTQVIISSITRITWKKAILYYFPQTIMLLFSLWLSFRHRNHRKRRNRFYAR